MSNPFFDHPILNSPYDYPRRHWELDEGGQPTQRIVDTRRSAKFITPIPKPKKRKAPSQAGFVFDEGKGLSTKEQQYDPTSIINEVRGYVDAWRQLSPSFINGRSRQRQPNSFNIGGTINSAACDRSSAKSRRRKPRFGSPRLPPSLHEANVYWIILPPRTGTPTRN